MDLTPDVLECISDAFVALDRDWCYTYVNQKAGDLLNRDPGSLTGKHIWTEFPESEGQEFRVACERAMHAQEPVALEAYIWRSDRYYENRIYPSANGIWILFTDISGRKKAEQAEQALRESESRYSSLFEASLDAVYTIDPEGRITQANAATAQLTGYPLEQLLEMTFHPLIAPEELERTVDHFYRTLAGESHNFDSTLVRPDGVRVEINVSAVPRFETGEIRGIFGIARDVTDRKRKDTELRCQKELLQTILDHIPVMIAFFDTVGHFQWVNRAWEAVLGYSLEASRRLDVITELYPDPTYRAEVLEYMLRADVGWRDFETRTRSGEVIATSWANVRLADGSTIGIGQDITGRKQAENALRQSEERLRQMAENIRQVFFLVNLDPEGSSLAYLSPAVEEIFGVSCAQAYANPQAVMRQIAPADSERVREAFKRAAGGSANALEYAIMRTGGREWLRTRFAPVRDDRGKVYRIAGATEVITGRRRAEEEASAAKAQIESFLNTIPDHAWLKDLSGRYLAVNEAYAKALDLSRDEILGKTDFDLYPTAMAKRFRDDDACVIEDVKTLSREELVKVRDQGSGDVLRWWDTRKAPCHDANGSVAGTVGIGRDITERKISEEALRSALQEKGALLQEVHHRVKNNLQIVSSLLRLQARAVGDPVLQTIFSEVEDRIRSMALLHEMLYRRDGFSRIELAIYLREIGRHLSHAYGVNYDGVSFEVVGSRIVDLDTAIPCGLIVNELVSNALKHAFPAGQTGTVRVEIRSEVAGDMWELEVSDDGTGIAGGPDAREGAIGLRLVNMLAAQLGATMRSSSDGGTRIVLAIPQKDSSR